MNKKPLLVFIAVFLIITIFFVIDGYDANSTDNNVLDNITKENVNYDGFVEIKSVKIKIYLSDTPVELTKGLSVMDSISDDEGMLFKFGQDDIMPSFWMKDMKFPIDIIWINDDKIVKIDKNIKPEPGKSDNELTLYSPGVPIDYVLEIPSGYSEKNNFEIGDLLIISLNN